MAEDELHRAPGKVVPIKYQHDAYPDECGGARDDEPPGPALPNLAAICARLPGKYKRVPTYCEPLDRATRGGLQTNRVIAIGGPPGVTKTTWTLGMGREMAERGVDTPTGTKPLVVAFAATDEPRDGLLSRLGQMYGVARSSLEDEDVTISGPAWAHVAARLADLPNLMIFDTRVAGEPATIDQIAEIAAKRAQELGGRLVLMIDSIQTAPFLSDAHTDGDKERISARMRSLQRLAIQLDACVLFISELNRDAYKKGGKATLASFKESGAVEYVSDLAVTLERIPDPNAFVVEVTPHKNRLGDENERFRLERNTRCLFEPVEIPMGVDTDEGKRSEVRFRSEKALVTEAAEKLLTLIVKTKKPPSSRDALIRLLRPLRRSIAQDAVSLLIDDGRIRKTKLGFRVAYESDETQAELELEGAPKLDKRAFVLELIRDQPGIARAVMARRLRDRGVTIKNDDLTLLLVELERAQLIRNEPDEKGAFHFHLLKAAPS